MESKALVLFIRRYIKVISLPYPEGGSKVSRLSGSPPRSSGSLVYDLVIWSNYTGETL